MSGSKGRGKTKNCRKPARRHICAAKQPLLRQRELVRIAGMELRAHPSESGLSSSNTAGFDYDAAFSRHIGWITPWEQQELRKKTIAIADMGRARGQHALTLPRPGNRSLH